MATGERLQYSTTNISDGWSRLSVTYTTTAAGNYRVAVVPTGITGTVYADALQLEKGDAPSSYNILENGSFEPSTISGMTGALYSWSISGNAQPKPTEVMFGSNQASLNGAAGAVRVYQAINLAKPGNTSFLLSGWAKATAVPNSAENTDDSTKPYFGLIIRLYYSDDTSEAFFFPFDAYYTDWQYIQGIVAPKKAENITIKTAHVAAAYDNNINSVLFDNLSLRMEPVYSYAYNDNGDPTSSTGTDTGTQTAQYSGVNLVKSVAPNGNITNFTYNGKHDVATATTDGLTTTYTRDTAGNVTSTKTEGSTVDPTTGATMTNHILTKSTMSADKNFVAKVEDQRGNFTQYEYDTYYALLNGSTNAMEIRTGYKYQTENGRVLQTYITNVAAIQYTYENGRLQQMTRKSFPNNADTDIVHGVGEGILQHYNFVLNPWGQSKSISVGSIPLATYEYEDVNGTVGAEGRNLKKMTYGNGDSVQYFYDIFDRPTKVVYNDTGKVVSNYYSADGSLAEFTYGTGNDVDSRYTLEYDNSGRIVRSARYDDGELSLRTEHKYDEFDRLYTQYRHMDGKTYYEQYRYDDGANGDGSLTWYRTPNGQQIYYTYDHLKRLTEASVKDGYGAVHFRTNYAFQNESADRTTTLVQYRSVRDGDGNLINGYKYTYDKLGNITRINHPEGNENLLYIYDYDDLSQLVTEKHYDGTGNNENDFTTGYAYNYDTAGNILSESKTQGGQTVTKTYTYGNSDWVDLLTAVNDSPIVYEGQSYNGTTVTGTVTSGNPIRYTNGEKTYTDLIWQHGRQLVSLTTGNETYTYDYDAEGIRTKKVVDGVTHTYLTLNGRVVRESYPDGNSTVVMDFIYDAQNMPYALLYSTNGGNSYATYYYATNAQGDVEGLFFTRKDSTTNKYTVHWMGHYRYDAWGNVISVTGPDGTTTPYPTNVMHRNPIRYRGYYYDAETGFYYLQSRYYDPVNHRFINADCYTNTGTGFLGFNMFAYCNNSPVLYSDYSGHALNSNVAVAIFDVGSNYWDVTMEVDAALFEECMDALTLFEEELIGQKERPLYLYLYFYFRVRSGAAWDIKLEESWKNTIGPFFPGIETKIVYHNIVLTPHNLGDLTYGVLGGFYGFDLDTLYTGSFVAAGLPEYGTSDWDHEVFVDWLYISIGYDIAPKPKKGG